MPSNLKTDGNGSVKRGPGRPKGSPNKLSAAARDVIALAAERLGGVDRLVDWVKEDPQNEKAFWSQVYPRLLPLQVANQAGEEFRTVTRIELVPMKASDRV